jgi:16S rRNA G1207 methylase RsmC
MEHDPGSGPRTPPHYFRPDAGTPHRPRRLVVRLRGRDVEVGTDAGVFSAGRLDLGTRVLLREAPDPPPTGDLLDLGCGWGPVALSMAMAAPRARVWAVDVNPRAVELTAGNAAELGLRGVRACLPEQVPEEVSFAAIWSNPPIRVGKADLHALLLRWLPRLAPGAEAHLVVQRTLGADSLQAWLGQALRAGFSVQRAGSAKGYRVIRIHRDEPLTGATDGAR